MTIQTYSKVPSRNLIKAEAEMLKHAEPIMTLTKFGMQKAHPKRSTDTVVYRRLKPFNATATETPNITAANFVLAEGTTPTSNTIDYTDVTVTLQHYGVLFKFTSKSADMYEDDIPGDMSKLTGETLAEVAEKVCFGEVKAGSSIIYAGGVASRTLVASAISSNALRLAARTLKTNRAKKVTETVKPGMEFGTSSVEAAFLVFMSTDGESDVRDLPGFTKRVDYGSQVKPVHENEIGAWEEFRFIPSPLFTPFLAGGVVIASAPTMLSAAGVNVDVYPFIVTAADAWGQVSLKGENKLTAIKPRIVPASDINAANPLGMFGYVGASAYMASVRLNENYMVRIEACVTDLDA